jgi:hypothetical protein
VFPTTLKEPNTALTIQPKKKKINIPNISSI